MPIDFTKVLVICKLSSIEHAQNKFNLSIEGLIKRYESEKIPYQRILESHLEHKKCINLVKQLLPQAYFINIYNLYTNKLNLNYFDLIVAIGGDEHFKVVVHHVGFNRTFLNICSNHLRSEAVLSSCNRLNVAAMIDNIIKGNYRVEFWPTIFVKINDKVFAEAFETLFIGARGSTDIFKYMIDYNDMEEIQKSSGVIIATGAGSTGWFRAAGGDSFDRERRMCRFIVREIYKGVHTRFDISNGEILAENSLFISNLTKNRGIINIDSVCHYSFSENDNADVFISDNSVKVISFV